MEDCWAATEVEQDFRRQYKEGNYEMAVLSGSYLWFCLESMDPERAAEVCLMFGSALYHRMEATRSDADLIFSADAFYAAFELYGAEAISKATWARLYEPYREEVRKLLSAAGARGEELLKTAKEDDTAKAAKVYGAIVTAGLLAEGQDDLIRHATVGSGSILVLHYYRDQNYRKGYEYGELALPLTDEIMGMDAAEIVKRLGRTQEVLSFSYLAFCACGQQLLSPKYNDFAKNGFLSSTVRPLYDTTEKALRMAERLGLKESEVTIARNFLNQIRDALVSKGK
jgi:hypothetical protein